MKLRHIKNIIVNSIDEVVIVQEYDPDFTYHQCFKCGNDSCNDCGQIFQAKPLHIVWHEDVCHECLDALAKQVSEEATTDDAIYWGP